MKGKVLPILSWYGASWVDIFRSLLRRECWPDSGMDILVEFAPECSLLDIARINTGARGSSGRWVDLVEYVVIKPAIRDRILAEDLQIL